MTENLDPQTVYRDPSPFTLIFWVSAAAALTIMVCDNAAHAVIHAFPSTCARGGSPGHLSSCTVNRITAVIGMGYVAFCLAFIAIIIAGSFAGTFRRHSPSECIAAGLTVAVTIEGTLLAYPVTRAFTHTAFPWTLGLLIDLVLTIGGITALTAVIVVGLIKNCHPFLTWRGKRRRRLHA